MNMRIIEVKAYKTTDGKLFLDECDAEEHQNRVDYFDTIEFITNNSSDITNFDNSREDVYDFIIRNATILFDTFKKYGVHKLESEW